MQRVVVLVAVVAMLLAGCTAGATPDLEVLQPTARMFALDHDPHAGTVHLLAGSQGEEGFEVRFGALDLATRQSVIHVEGLPTPSDPWVGVDRDGAAWAFGGGLSWDAPAWLWRVDPDGARTEVPVVRLTEVGCEVFDQAGIGELGVLREGTVLHPRLLVVTSPAGDDVAVEVAHERARGPSCGPERRDLTQAADLQRNLQPVVVDAWLATAQAAANVRWVDPGLGLAVAVVPSRRLWTNMDCERQVEQLTWGGRTFAMGSCYHSLGPLPTSGHLAVGDDALLVSHAGAVALLRR